MPNPIKGVPIAPLTGVLDLRSSPDLMPPGALRYRQNLQVFEENKLRRGCGWAKLLSQANYNNQDLHDQLLTFTEGSAREPITYLREAVSSRGIRSLFAGTQSRLLELNESSGNWRLIADGLGGGIGTDCSGPRFHSAVLGDYLVFTNDFDRPKYHFLEQPAFESSLIADISDLEVIGLTKAGKVWQWRNVIFLADVEMDNERFSYRVVWSNYNEPTSFDPAKAESIAGFKDFNYGERILAGAPCGNVFLIYTTHGVWAMQVAAQPDKPFDFVQIYKGQDNEFIGCLKYENTLVNLGGAHLYMGADRFYSFTPYSSAPDPVEWLHRADKVLYQNIEATACSAHVATFHENEALFSVLTSASTNGCPDMTLRVNTLYKMADIVDHGFSAFCTFRPQRIQTIRDFIIDQRICTLQNLDDEGYGFVNEGLPAPLPTPTATIIPHYFTTGDTYEQVYGVVTEDWENGYPSIYSLCYALGNTRLSDLCRVCESPPILVGVSSADWCLKQIGGVFYRERCANPTTIGSIVALGYYSSVGSYVLDGYDSIIRFAPMFVSDAEIVVERLMLNFEAVPQTPPSNLQLRVGISGQIADPNTDECRLVWHQHESRALKCISPKTPAQHRAGSGTVPSQLCEWRFFRQGRIVYLELKIAGTGGDATFSGAVADARAIKGRNY